MTESRHLTRYLLGEMSDDERADVEKRYFADDGFFEQLVETENDLVDAYVRGSLAPAERKRFEQHLLTNPAIAEKTAFARTFRGVTALSGLAAPRPSQRARLWRIAAAASLAAILAAVSFLLFSTRSRESRTAPPHQRAIQPPPQAKVPAEQPAPQSTIPSAKEGAIVTALLTPGGSRDSDQSQPLAIGPSVDRVRLELILQADRYSSYTARLEDVDGRELWRDTPLRPEGPPSRRRVALGVPAKLLPSGDYVVLLEGLRLTTAEEIGNYTFSVIARPARR